MKDFLSIVISLSFQIYPEIYISEIFFETFLRIRFLIVFSENPERCICFIFSQKLSEVLAIQKEKNILHTFFILWV